VLDLGCSYGVNAALLKHDLSMRELYERWGQNGIVRVNWLELGRRDPSPEAKKPRQAAQANLL
jgi:hypothetical protein